MADRWLESVKFQAPHPKLTHSQLKTQANNHKSPNLARGFEVGLGLAVGVRWDLVLGFGI